MGCLSLSELDSITGGSVTRSLIRRELGAHDKTIYRISGLMHRQLIKGRSKSNVVSEDGRQYDVDGSRDITSYRSPRARNLELSSSTTARYRMIPEKLRCKRNPIFKQSGHPRLGSPHTVLDTSSVPATVAIFGDYIFIRKIRDNEPSYCYSMKFLTNRNGLKHKYGLMTTKEWKDTELFEPATDNPDPIIYKQKFGTAVLALKKDSPYLVVYDLDTGRTLEELFLSDDRKILHTSMALCWDDLSRFVVQSSKSRLPPTLLADYIILEYPPLKVSLRCQITKKAFPKAIEADVAAYFIYVVYANYIEICDLKSILNPEFEHEMQKSPAQAPGKEVPVKITHYVDAKLPVLQRVNTFHSHLELTALGSLPHFISMNKDGTLRVQNFEEMQVGNSDLLNLNLRSDTDKNLCSLKFHPDESPRLIFCGENRLRVLRLIIKDLPDGRPGDSCLETEFDFTQAQSQSATTQADRVSAIPPGRRSERNVNRRISYADESEVGVKWSYHSPIDVFAIMEMSKDSVKFYLYDNQNWSSIAIIEPMDFWRAPMENGEFTVPVTTFDIQDSHLIVQIHKTSQSISKVYLAGLLSEPISDGFESLMERCQST